MQVSLNRLRSSLGPIRTQSQGFPLIPEAIILVLFLLLKRLFAKSCHQAPQPETDLELGLVTLSQSQGLKMGQVSTGFLLYSNILNGIIRERIITLNNY